MKEGLTEIVCIVDKSGSMESVKTDAIGAFNRFINEQKGFPGEARITLTLFDTEYDIVHNGIDIQNAPELNEGTFQPGGMTALLDALGRTIDEVGSRLNKTPASERPEKVVVVVLTDGEENSSREYTKAQVFKKITHQRNNYDWEFIFLGAGQDTIEDAKEMGIAMSQKFVATGAGINHAWDAVSQVVSSVRSTGKHKHS